MQTTTKVGSFRFKLLNWVGYATFVWSTIFGLIHVYWAVGGTALLEGTMAGLLAVINLVAIISSLISAIIALAIVQEWGQRIPSWILLTSTWIACAVLSL